MAIVNTTIIGLAGSEKTLGALQNVYLPIGNQLIASGAMVRSSDYDALAGSGPRVVDAPYLAPLSDATYNEASDDINVPGNVEAMTGSYLSALVTIANKGIADTDLTKMVTGVDPLNEAARGMAAMWNRVIKRRTAKMLTGCQLAAGANYLVDLSGNTGSAAFLNGVAVADAQAQLGENDDLMNTILVHPAVKARFRKDDIIAGIPTSKTDFALDTYLGLKVVECDALPVVSGVYTSVIMKAGALGYGQAAPLNPVEFERIANGGNGQGGTILHSRVRFTIVPQAFTYVKGSGPLLVPSETQLAAAAQWAVAPNLSRSDVPFTFIKSKIA